LRNALIETQCGSCWYCGSAIVGKVRTPHVDHQHPRIRGGSDDIENLVAACASCNIRKSDRTVDEYRAYLIARDGLEADFLFYMEQPK
jgi:5-methylcytosine-specific restriction endonuclease McrA